MTGGTRAQGSVLHHPGGIHFRTAGGTGSGKSTLTYLLARLYDLPEDCGSITISGVDIRKIRLSYLRENVGLVLQEPFLFSKTIGENIRGGRPDAPRRGGAGRGQGGLLWTTQLWVSRGDMTRWWASVV